MILSLIVAYDRNRVIGNDKKIPWHLPADFAYFKKTTMGHPVIMGRTTFESIGKPLPGRRNIILTRHPFPIKGVEVFDSLEKALERLKDEQEVFVIGGEQVYALALPLADKLYVTFIKGDFAGDKFFPKIDENLWKKVSVQERDADEENVYGMKFVVFERIT
ncbi:MAG: dihydrofolate reductase [Candidatus Pacebacteria bacterium]|nr:dihydrofolate reductase [Candidatus Paceibacterota bacterium]